MIPIERGQAVCLGSDPMTHAYWWKGPLFGKERETVVAACKAFSNLKDAYESEVDINCMACIVRMARQ